MSARLNDWNVWLEFREQTIEQHAAALDYIELSSIEMIRRGIHLSRVLWQALEIFKRHAHRDNWYPTGAEQVDFTTSLLTHVEHRMKTI